MIAANPPMIAANRTLFVLMMSSWGPVRFWRLNCLHVTAPVDSLSVPFDSSDYRGGGSAAGTPRGVGASATEPGFPPLNKGFRP
mgnify:CR=1 FL=1